MKHLSRAFFTRAIKFTPLFALQKFGFQSRFSPESHGQAQKTTTPQPPKLTIKHRGVNKNPDDEAFNLNLFADLPKFNDPSKSICDIPENFSKILEDAGYVKPTLIQQKTIPMVLLGEDMIGLAPTGTGKTLAFAIPALIRINPRISQCQVLILCPTRELAMQTYNVFFKMTKRMGIRCGNAYGGQQNRAQQAQQCKDAHILIATPGRLTDFAREGIIDLSKCQLVVLDEADRLLDMGFKPQIDDIMYFFHSNNLKPQTLMWSATWDEKIQDLARSYIKENHFLVSTGAHEIGHSVNPLINQCLYFVNNGVPERIQILLQLYEDKVISMEEKVILFVERKGTAAHAHQQLNYSLRQINPRLSNLFCKAVHGDLKQSEREQAIFAFKNGPCNLLVATDVVARGIDIPNVSHVVNYEMPSQFDSYVHRIGRTGRNGCKGFSHAFFDMQQDVHLSPQLENFMRHSGQEIPHKLTELVPIGEQAIRRKAEKKEYWDRKNKGQKRNNSFGY